MDFHFSRSRKTDGRPRLRHLRKITLRKRRGHSSFEAADEEHYQAPLIQHGLVPKTTFLQDMEKTRPAQAEISMASWSQADIDAAAGRWSVAPGSHTWRIARHAFTDGSTFSNDCPWSRSGYSVVLQTRDEYDLPDGWYDLNG